MKQLADMPDRADDRPLPTARRVEALLVAAIGERAERQDLSVSALAARAGVDAERLGGGRELRVSDLAAVAEVLGVSASVLIARAEALGREGEPDA